MLDFLLRRHAKDPTYYGDLALIEEIRADLRRAKQSRWDILARYRSAGKNLSTAKELVGHGGWERWLEINFSLSDRTARRYMEFSITDAASDLDEEEKNWRGICGHGGKKKTDDDDDDEGSDRYKTYELVFEPDQYANFETMVNALIGDAMGPSLAVYLAVEKMFKELPV